MQPKHAYTCYLLLNLRIIIYKTWITQKNIECYFAGKLEFERKMLILTFHSFFFYLKTPYGQIHMTEIMFRGLCFIVQDFYGHLWQILGE